MELIRTENLAKVYEDDGIKTEALRNINLSIKEGEFVAVIGPSGSGKSTLMQILGCLDRPTSGKYFFEEKEIHSYTDDELAHIRNYKVGFVFQSFNLLPRLSVLENVVMPLIYRGTPDKEREKKAKEVIELIGLSDRIDYQTSQLSGGQKQRVAIARALVTDPKIIFADEPTGNLDSKSGEVVLRFIQELNHQGHTIVIVTHESYVAQAAKRMLHIVDGEIDKDETVANQKIISKEGFSK
ncbi:MAG: ABC transporter related protein [Candidatus Wolfebacteria bacterium GW2011_GWC1_43_10]|uniref:ABC transporter related protein n=2 Tax=Candidatus Wolfeibacteriota TaxID=1752735 RepID=A0A0G1EI79_9BACT|nr:MAG: ABC transporter related protein [Candidatus Wolfebacteria bacterium GW2011_GWC1_43_10]KKT22931.1 MAG: ABC transporter related protein [Parcubacteria group bacterium GW2011_GWB1_43_8b]OGM89956.1 MAG: macrolide ABC transporter ATP-binding protein [Candidatus Wolfebacteria bacterium GWA1_42_9]